MQVLHLGLNTQSLILSTLPSSVPDPDYPLQEEASITKLESSQVYGQKPKYRSYFDVMPIQQNNNSMSYLSAYNLPSHGLLTRITVPGMTFHPIGACFKCSQKVASYSITAIPLLHQQAQCCLPHLNSLHSTLQHYKIQPTGEKFPGLFEIDLSVSCSQHMWCLQQQAFTL